MWSVEGCFPHSTLYTLHFQTGDRGETIMTEREKFWYDTMGYLVVKDFLTPEEVDRLNAAFDANRDKMGEDGNSNTGNSRTLKGHKRGIFTGMLEWEHPWCDPFRELLVHPKAIP